MRVILLLLNILLSFNFIFSLPKALSVGRQTVHFMGENSAVVIPQPTVFSTDVKAPAAIFNGAVDVGGVKSSLSTMKILFLGILSGCHIGFGSYLSLSVGGACTEIAKSNPGLQKIILGAFGLPFGLMMTVIAGGELFTGNTALVGAAVIEGKADLKSLAKNWVFSYLGNFIGSILLAWLAYTSGTLGVSTASVTTATAKCSLTFIQAFVRGILCNWLVSMAVYMASGASTLTSKMVAIWFPISAFIALGLEHSVANMFFIPLGIMRGAEITIIDFLWKNLFPVTLGNIVGGALCVGAAYAYVYGSKNSISPAAKSPSSKTTSKGTDLLQFRGGFSASSSGMKPTGTSFLSPEALEKAQNGNMFEKVKLKKDGSAMWTEIAEYAEAIRSGKINWEDIASDDMDIRVKYAGMFHRKKATPGKFMMRLRIPNGIVTSEQMRYFANAVKPYGPEIGVIDITTRANIQLRGMPIEDGDDIIKGLQALNLTSLMSGLDNLRNMVGSPIAGIDPHELFDTRALTKQIDDWYTNNGKGNPAWANMPRKFNIAISGSRDDFAHTHINDIGFNPVPHSVTGEMGFNVVLGGYFSIKRAAGAIDMNVWIPANDAFDLSRAVLRLFRDLGARGDRQKTRLMWLIESMGLDVFKEAVAAEMSEYRSGSYKFDSAQPFTSEWTMYHRDLLGVHSQKQSGLSWVGVHVPVGRLSTEECYGLADIADKYCNGELRFTVEQNVLFPNIPNDRIDEFLKEGLFNGNSRLRINPGNVVGHVISCTGAQFCPVALIETKLNIVTLTKKLDELLNLPKPVRIHMTGCPNSCGQVQLADIGLMGAPAKKANADGVMKAVSGVNIFVGGRIGEDAFIQQEPSFKGIPLTEEDLIPVLTQILTEKFGGKLKI
eukprot:gene5178-7205_t